MLSSLIAVPVGLSIATSPVGRGILDPLVEFIRPLPPPAHLPLIIIWFGIGEPSKVLVIALAMIAPIAISTAAGVRTASPSAPAGPPSSPPNWWQRRAASAS